MKTIDHHEAWELKPRKLTLEETISPESVLQDFFQQASLPESRFILWEGMKTLVTGTFNHLKKRERSSLIYFFEQIERLIEANYLINEREKHKMPGKSV